MIQFHEAKIQYCIIHKIGNKNEDGGYQLSNSPINLNDNLNFVLTNYFFRPFLNIEERWSFSHVSDVGMNAVYQYASTLFEGKNDILRESVNIARYLYDCSSHPKIKSGELYVVYFKDCILDGEIIDAIGIFKSENKDTFIRINPVAGGFSIESESGININKLDKGCLVFNKSSESGYIVTVVDNTNRGEAKYWIEDFLHLRRINDGYTQTMNMVTLCKNFISQLPSEINKSHKAAMMNRVVDGLKEEVININDMAEDVFGKELAETSFSQYKKEYEERHDVSFEETFHSRPDIIKKQSIRTTTTIKLDKNFVINILGGEQFIESGRDDNVGMKYYKLYYREER